MSTAYLIQFLLFAGSFSTTPSAAEWTRKSLIGFNDNEFIYLEFKRNTSGTYYSYIDSSFLVSKRYDFPDSTSRDLLRVTLHEDSAATGNWIMKELVIQAFDLNQYMVQKNMHYAFNSTRPDIGALEFENYGLALSYRGENILLLSMEKINKQASDLKEYIENKDLEIISKYASKKFLLLTIQTGLDTFDSNFNQYILAVPMNELREAESSFRKMNRK